ncbi:2708_t:CDS:2 [Cetraspora pellucida]|uniref:2708_t:CDS:1 n=1 Tax=Cetraspora pellucida TaxID=1433469 RepID=A0A9N9CTL9_9GLOM|nr:2708_t:CDS:2 [Cetraspora pellucida]
MGSILHSSQPQRQSQQLPDLPDFITKIIHDLNLPVLIVVVGLIYVHRLKKQLPENYKTEYGTAHRVFISSILVASKYVDDVPITARKMSESVGKDVWSIKEIIRMVPKPSDFGMEYTEEILSTKDDVNIRAYICKLPQDARNRPTILFFHANAGNMGHRLPIAQIFYVQFKCNVCLISYRGEGRPSEKGIRIDAQTFLDHVMKDDDLKNTKLITFGQSLGGAISIDLVSRNEDKFSAMILENTFLSIPKVIPYVMPQLKYLSFLCHQIWPSETSIQQIVHTPILFLSGARDEIVPPSHMTDLFELSQTKVKEFKRFDNGFHNDTTLQPGYFETISEFLKKENFWDDEGKEWVEI